MKAVVWRALGDIRVEEVPDPKIEQPTDAVIRLTASAICGTDLHFIRGTFSGMVPGTVLGHEGVGVVETVGADVGNFAAGDRVVVCSTIACGVCGYCRRGYFAQCDRSNPNGPDAGTSFFGGPRDTGPVNGLQAQRARIPFAATTLVRIPDGVTDDQAILISDIFPTGWYGAILAEVKTGDTVAVFGCGPVGQFAIASAILQGATRVIAVDSHPDRLAMARKQGAFPVNFDEQDPVAAIKRLTGGTGADRAIDAVGVDAQHAHHGPAGEAARKQEAENKAAVAKLVPKPAAKDGNWVPGDAPGQALEWAIGALAKAGTLGIIGVYPPNATTFPIGKLMNKNLSLNAGNCNHRAYIPHLLELARAGTFDPRTVITQHEHLTDAVAAYEAFDKREEGWIKTELQPAA